MVCFAHPLSKTKELMTEDQMIRRIINHLKMIRFAGPHEGG
jgi:hypothetical protein